MNSLYRQAAIDQMSSPERLDEAPAVTRPPDWLLLLAMTLVLGAAAYWGVRGRIAAKADGQGVILLSGGVVNVYSDAPGRVRDVRVNAGDRVNVNQIIGSISQPLLRDKLQSMRESLAELERERERSVQARGEGLRLQSGVIENQGVNLEREIAATREQIKVMSEQFRVEEELLGKGLITRQQLLATQQKINAAENTIAGYEAQKKQLASSEFQNQSQSSAMDRDQAARIAEARRAIQQLEAQLGSASVVRSPYAGKVIELKVYRGGLVGMGEPFLSLEPEAERFEGIAYVSTAYVKGIHSGMKVEIVPASVKREEYGYLRGEVISVAEFPATRAAMMRNFENESLVTALTGAGPVNEVRLKLEADAGTASGFRWSTPQGPPFRISSGTLCAVSVVTREQPPLELAFPFLARKR